MPSLRQPAWFDPQWYVHRYPEIAAYRGGALLHFYLHGAKEVRQPSPHIDMNVIFDRHENLIKAPVEDIFAVVDRVVAESPQDVTPDDEASLTYLVAAHGLFDEAWYLSRNRDVSVSEQPPIEHFVRYGAVESRDPSPAFDTDFYRAEHPEFIEESRTAIEHFVRIGLRRGYAGVGRSPYARWIEAFDELTPSDLERLKGETLPDERVAAFHIVGREAAAAFARILEGWRSQAGVRCDVTFVRAANLDDATWAACRAAIEGQPRLHALDPTSGPPDLPQGGTVILAADTVIVRPHTASMLAAALARSQAEAAYADHDHLDADGQRSRPAFKPGMSPEFMRHQPYAGPLIAVGLQAYSRSSLVDLVGQAAAGGDASRLWADHLLALAPGKVAHVPFILSHHVGSTPSADLPTPVRSTAAADELPSVTIVIPTRDRVELLRDCIQSILSDTDYPEALRSLVVVDNDSRQPETLAYLAELSRSAGVIIERVPGRFNFSHICNRGAARAPGQILVFLNNDTTVLRRDWLRQLAHFARDESIGVVGAHLLYPDGSTQHGGIVLGVQGVGAHRHKPGLLGPAGVMDMTREMVAVTGACLAIRQAVFAAVGGFDPVLEVAFNDVKLCARVHEAGYRNIYVADPLLYHHESKSRGFDVTAAQRRRNAREAMYVREQFGSLFRADPTYSPNLSLQAVDKLGTPPRAVRPWRRTRSGEPRRILLLCYRHGPGQGVATVLEQQAGFLRKRGWDVTVGGPQRTHDRSYEGCRRVNLWTAEAAAAFAVAEGIDCVVAHSPPFFSITRYLGAEPVVYFTDHGEPPPHLFPDREAREEVDWEKRFCTSLARRVFVISEAVRAAQYRADAMLIRNGNSHLSRWSDSWAQRRAELREKFGFDDAFVVLKVCRFGPEDRVYKGVIRYGEVASELPYRYPDLHGKVRFVLVGRGDEDDVAAVEAMGLETYANITDADLIDLYAAGDLYTSFSEWEGYNLGIGQALAMGLEAVASDIPAHREFGIEVSDSVPRICASLARHYARRHAASAHRQARIEAWETSLALMAETMEDDLGHRGDLGVAVPTLHAVG